MIHVLLSLVTRPVREANALSRFGQHTLFDRNLIATIHRFCHLPKLHSTVLSTFRINIVSGKSAQSYHTPWKLVIDGKTNELFVLLSNKVMRFSSNGDYIGCVNEISDWVIDDIAYETGYNMTIEDYPAAYLVDARGMASSSSTDQLFVSDFDRGHVVCFYVDGQDSEPLAKEHLVGPLGLSVDAASKELYVADYAKHSIVVLSLEGSLMRQFSVAVHRPIEVEVHPTKPMIFVASEGFHIQAYSKKGELLHDFAAQLPEGIPTPRDDCYSIGFHHAREMLLAGWRGSNRLFAFDTEGNKVNVCEFPTALRFALHPNADRIYQLDEVENRVSIRRFCNPTRKRARSSTRFLDDK